MFNIGFAELILILLVAFVIVGPKDLPKVARAIGRAVRSIRKMFDEFKDETGLDETIEDLKDAERDLGNTVRDVDPRVDLKQAQRDAEKVIHDAEKDVKSGLSPKTMKK